MKAIHSYFYTAHEPYGSQKQLFELLASRKKETSAFKIARD